jgi:hypothetical protein
MDVTISGAKDRELTKMLRLATYSFSKNLFSYGFRRCYYRFSYEKILGR